MAQDGSVVFGTELDTGGLKSGLGSVGKIAQGATKTFSTGIKGMSIALGAVSTGLGFLAKTAVSYNSSMENYVTNFGVMLGDEAAAVEHVAELREMAAKTPFGMQELADASQTMLSFGLDAEYSMRAMQQLGDISLGNKERFGSLALAFSQVSAAGKLTGQDLLQMINAGFNPLNTIAEKTGVSIGDLKDVMAGGKGSKDFQKAVKAARKEVAKMGDQASEGAKWLAKIGEEGMISAEMVGWAMEAETSPGGRFFNGMLKASETFAGMLSTLEDDATALVGKVFEPFTQQLTTGLLPLAQGYINRLSAAFDEAGTDGLIKELGLVIGDALSKSAENLPQVLQVASDILTSVGAALIENSDAIAEGLSGAVSAVVDSDFPDTFFETLSSLGKSIITSVAGSIQENAGEIISGLGNGLLAIGSVITDPNTISALAGAAKGIVNGIADALPELLPQLATGLVSGIGAVIGEIPELAGAAANLVAGLKKGLFGENGAGGAVGEIAQSIIDGINGFFAENFPELKFKLPQWEDIVAWATELKKDLEEFFKITVGLQPPSLNGENPYSPEENPLLYNFAEGAQIVKDNYKEFTWNDLWEAIFPSAGAEELPQGIGSFATNVASQSRQELLDAFANGKITYDELVAAAFPSGEGSGDREGPASAAVAGLAVDILGQLSMGLEEGSDSISTSVGNVLVNAKNAANPSQFVTVGYMISVGIAQGIRNGTSAVAAAVRSVIAAALAAARKAADINSPSRLFRDQIGLGLAEGTALGVESNAHLLETAVTKMVNASIPDMRGVGTQIMNRSASYTRSDAMMAALAGGSFNQTNNFNVPVQTPDEFADTMHIYATYGLQG